MWYDYVRKSMFVNRRILLVSLSTVLLFSFLIGNAYSTHLTPDTKWQIIYLTSNPACSNYDYQMMRKYTQITEEYFELYKFANSKYDPLCSPVSGINSKYSFPQNLDLTIIVLDRDLGEKELHSKKMGGLYTHYGNDRMSNHVIIMCDCSNFYYSEPTWILSHELSHFILYTLNFDVAVVEKRIHTLDDVYDKCMKVYSDECSTVKAKLWIEEGAYSYSVMPPYQEAIDADPNQIEIGEVPPPMIEISKIVTKWWAQGKISEGDYANVLGYFTSAEEYSQMKNEDVIFAESPTDKTGPRWHEILTKTPEKKQELLSKIPFNFNSELERIYENNQLIGLPEWFKQTATWWLEEKVTADEFRRAVQYLHNEGIIRPQ